MVSFSFKVPFNEPYDSKQDMDDSLLIYLSIYTQYKNGGTSIPSIFMLI